MSEAAPSQGTFDVDAALALARQRGVERLDAQLLLAHGLGKERGWLLAHGDAALAAEAMASFEQGLSRRLAGEPLAYIVGTKEFYGLALQVDGRVLVPRPETELLVDWALALLLGECASSAQPKVADLGTGSGAVAIAIGHRHPRAQVWATDLSEEALTVARANAQQLCPPIQFAQGAWWSALRGLRFDLVVSNPPYIADGDEHLRALGSEPRGALTPGPSGMEALRAIVSGAPQHLVPGGWLLVEHGFEQAAATRALLVDQGFRRVSSRQDLAGHLRCTGGQL